MQSLAAIWSQATSWLAQHAQLGWWTLGLSVAVSLGGIWLVRWLVLQIPHDYFARPHVPGWRDQHPLVRLGMVVGKNLLGAVLLILGLTMLVTPGPGIVTVLVALVLLDVPGKRALEHRIVALPAVLQAINRLRRRANRPELEMPVRAANR